MKSVVLGSDFIKTPSGDFKLLEINTSIGASWDMAPHYDLTAFKAFVTSNLFTEVHAIFNYYSLRYNNAIKAVVEGELGLTYVEHPVANGSITVPYVEDADDRLIIRFAYDTTAIVDDSYARDKVGVQKLVHNQSYGAATYIPSVCDDFDGMADFNYSGDTPNYIKKKRYPSYEREDFPTLYKVQNLAELNVIKATVLEDEYLQEYVLSDLENGKRLVYRSIDLLYGSNLTTLNLGGFKALHSIREDIWANTYSDAGILAKKDRPKYITYYAMPRFTDSPFAYTYDLDQEVLMGDETRTEFTNIQVNDTVKALNIPGLDLNEGEWDIETWNTPYADLIASASLVDTTVVQTWNNVVKSMLFLNITTDDGTSWNDLENSKILVKDGDNVRFKTANDLLVGDVIITYNASSTGFVERTVTSIEIVFIEDNGVGTMDVEPYDLYLPFINQDLTLIQHNTCKIKNCAPNGCINTTYCNTCGTITCSK